MHVKVNTGVRSCNHCCNGKAISIAYSESVFVAECNAPYFIVVCGLPGCTIFFPHYLINGTIFEKRFWTMKRVLIFSTPFVWNISHSEKNWERYDQIYLLVFMWSTRYSCQILMKLEFSRQRSKKYSNIEFYENSSSVGRVVACGQTDRQTWGR